MAVAIHATCPTCGVVVLTASDMRLMLCDADEARNHYAFECPGCGTNVAKPADRTVIGQLVAVGVRRTYFAPPSDAPALTLDDLIDFGLALAATDYPLVELAAK